MQRPALIALSVVVSLLFSACNSGSDSGNARPDARFPEVSLTLLHTNDIHARLEPIAASGGAPELGGVARIKTLVEQVRAERGADNVLLVDAGDYSQGTIFWNAWKGAEAVMFLNAIGYDAITLGNHEFNLGPDNLTDRFTGQPVTIAGVDRATESIRLPVVATNLDLSGEPGLAMQVQPSAIIERAGVRFGILGLLTDTTSNISSPGPGVIFRDYVSSVQAEVDRLRQEEGIEHFILLSHVNHSLDVALAARLSGVDIIVSGHDHVLLGDPQELPEWSHDQIRGPYPAVVTDRDGGTTLVVSAWEWTRVLGRLDVTFDDEGRVSGWSGGPIVADLSVAEDADLVGRVAAYRAPVDEFANVIIGSAGLFFDGARIPGVRSTEMPLGNLVTDAMLSYPQLDGLNVQVALTNGGGIRASINQGDVSFGDVLAVLPFGNTLQVVDVTGEELVAALDNGLTWAYNPSDNSVRSSGAWPHVAGMVVRFCQGTVADIQAGTLPPRDCDGALRSGGVVRSVEMGGEPLDYDATYRVVTNDFLAGGGDFYLPLQQACAREGNFCEDTFLLMLDALVEQFERHSPVTHALEGRLLAE